MKEINIVLTQTNTVISKTLKAVTKKPYNHISISFNDDCKTMFSFGRKIIWFPLIGGFVKENVNRGIFKMHPDTKCKIYKIDVTDADYKFLAQPNSFKYSYLNLFLIYFNIPLQRKNYYVCSSFVTFLLWGIIPFKKEISLMIPDDYNELELNEVYEGKLKDYVNRRLSYNNT